MYLITNEDNKPFAILTELNEVRLSKAIEEEFSVKDVKIEKTPYVDWGESSDFNVEATDLDEGDKMGYTLTVTKLVSY